MFNIETIPTNHRTYDFFVVDIRIPMISMIKQKHDKWKSFYAVKGRGLWKNFGYLNDWEEIITPSIVYQTIEQTHPCMDKLNHCRGNTPAKLFVDINLGRQP